MALRGRSLLPGFIDAHCHLTGLGMGMVSIDWQSPGMPSIEVSQKAVYERAVIQPPGAWIRGRGYDQTRLHERRYPTRDDWDVVAPHHSIIFTRTCGHISSVNSQALAMGGITDQTPDGATTATGAGTSVWHAKPRKPHSRWRRCQAPRSLAPRCYVPITPIWPPAAPVCMTPVVSSAPLLALAKTSSRPGV
jgi:Amidohydrolase family